MADEYAEGYIHWQEFHEIILAADYAGGGEIKFTFAYQGNVFQLALKIRPGHIEEKLSSTAILRSKARDAAKYLA